MSRYVASFLGRDCPGVVAAVAHLLQERQCSIVEFSQTILTGEFAAIVIVDAPDSLSAERLAAEMRAGLAAAQVDLSTTVRPTTGESWATGRNCQPFVVSADGPDRVGQIAGISGVFARHGVNIENVKAILGEGGPGQALFVFEVMVPDAVEITQLRQELRAKGEQLGLRVSVQHRDIFEAVHRVLPV